MKKVFWQLTVISALVTGFILPVTGAFAYETENKKVCIDKIDKGKPVLDKEGKPVQTCKTVVVHKKLEGTKPEDAKKEQGKK